ncbi:MAG: large-conductance mechanosensitive channel protein MscL [Bacteroidales bacterium]|nr:large-conductance mechanosensitive channel protein MscL [Bacteroidales bacterium]
MGLFKEFKEFAVKGNVMDMAIGVVIGGAFGKIVTSLVSDLIMPLIGAATGGLNFTDWKWVVRPEVAEQVNEAGEVIQQAVPALTLNYGNFLQVIFDFLIIAFSIFLVVKGINNMKAKFEKPAEPEAPAAPAGPTQEELLTEIRDLLKNK